MRILHVIPSMDPSFGGPVAALASLGKAQRELGAEVTVVAAWRTPAEREAAALAAPRFGKLILIGPVVGPTAWNSRLAPEVSELVRQADIVHVHGVWEEILHHAMRTARRLGKPYVVRPCGSLGAWPLSHHRLRKALYMRWRLRANLDAASLIHYVSAPEAREASVLRLAAPDVTVANGLDLDEFRDLPSPAAFRLRQGIPEDVPIILFLSRLHEKKHPDLLIEAFAQAKTSTSPVLVLAGPVEPAMKERLTHLARSLAVLDRVRFTGMLRGVERVEALAAASAFVLPSHSENFGVAVVEAIASGTTAIVSDQVGLAPLLRERGWAHVVPVDTAAVAAKLEDVLGDPSAAAAAATKSRREALDYFDARQVAARWLEIYQDLAGEAAPESSIRKQAS